MQITNSPDITNLDVEVTWDLSGTLPAINLVNLSTGSNLAGVDYAFVAKSPTGTVIHDGDIDNPDVSGIWDTQVLSDAFPRPLSQIEWSGAPYTFYVIAKDSIGNIYTAPVQNAVICRPAGNTPNSKNPYGIASSNVEVKCQQARIFFEDTTYHTYKGLEGTQISSTLRVIYPIDETYNIPAPFVAAGYSAALVPISYSSSNYQFLQTTIYDYDLGNDVKVRIKYILLQSFSVWCNIDLMPLVCEINKLIDSVQNGTCGDVIQANKILGIINSKMVLVFMGIMQPLIGVDVPLLIEEIKAIGGFVCDCCSAPTGIIPQTAAIIDGYSFTVNKLGGDVNGYFSTNGNNIILNIGDVKYVVRICQDSPSDTSAFSFDSEVSGDGFTKTYCLNVDGSQLAEDILNIVGGNAGLVNLFNTLINNNNNNVLLVVDGGCIFDSGLSCDYDFSLDNIPLDTTFAIITSIKVGSISHPLNFAFNMTNLPALQAYLGGQGFGAFTVTDEGNDEVLIESLANPNNLVSITYKTGGINYIAEFNRVCNGYVQISANQVVQQIIDYLCALIDTQISTSQDYEICYIDPVSRTKKTVTVSGGASLNAFLIALLDRGCDTTDYIVSLSALTCSNIQALFPTSPSVMGYNDFLLGTKAGACARLSPIELGTTILNLGAFSFTFLEAFCNLVELCRGGKPCTPFVVYTLSVIQNSPDDDTFDILVTFVNPDPLFIGAEIRYLRIDNLPATPPVSSYTLGSSVSGGSGTTVMYTINNVAEGQYSVALIPQFSDGRVCPAILQSTPACSGISEFIVEKAQESNKIKVSWTSTVKMRVHIDYPNGSYKEFTLSAGTDEDTTEEIAAQDGIIFGFYTIYARPYCNVATGWLGAATPPVILEFTPENNSSIENNTADPINGISGTSFSADGNNLLFSASTIPGSGGQTEFFIEAGFYSNIVVNYSAGTVAAATLFTLGMGTISGVLTAGTITFSNITVTAVAGQSEGVAIDIT